MADMQKYFDQNTYLVALVGKQELQYPFNYINSVLYGSLNHKRHWDNDIPLSRYLQN